MSGVFQNLSLLRTIRFRKARALLFFLLHAPEQDHRSEKIADVFWRDYTHVKAMASLRQTIRQIRLLLDDMDGVSLITRRGHLGLRCVDKTPIDARICAELASPPWGADIEQALGHYQQEFDLLLGISDAFDSWLSIKKAQAIQEIASVLEARYTTAHGSHGVQAAKLAQMLEPSNEVATRQLMRHFWANQQPNRAIETYNTLFAHLDHNFDQEPEADTINLLASIKMGEPVPSGPSSPDTPPQILVQMHNAGALPPEEQSLLNVLFLDLRMRLSRFREWGIADADSPTNAVDLVVKIQLLPQIEGAPLHIEITKPEANNLLWAEMIPFPQENWDEKVRTQLGNIANALSLGAGGSQAPVQEARIYDRWLRSQVLIDRWSPETESEAIDMLGDITMDAPRFGPAHAELAGALNVRHILLPGTVQTEAEKQRALHHALEAISLDPLDTRAHRVLAWCYCHKAEFELAEFHFEQAMHLNSSNPLTLASCALGFAFANRLEPAQEICERMLRAPEAMQPFHLVYLAAVNYLSGDYARTVEQCARTGDIMTTVGGWHAAALFQLGRTDEAQARIKTYIASIKNQWSLPNIPSDDAVLDWYTACFPLREAAVRKALRETVGSALQG